MRNFKSASINPPRMNDAHRLPAVAGLVGALGLAACAGPTPHYYADAGHSVATYAEVRAAQKPETLHLDLHFLHNGIDDPAAAKVARDDILRVLDQVGSFTVTDDPQASTLSVVVHGSYDPHNRTGGSLLTHDLLYGRWYTNTVVDPLRFEFAYRPAGGAVRIAHYDHATLSTLAHNSPEADDRGPFTDLDAAFDATIEDVTLHFLKDLQGSTQTAAPLVYLP
jgi:hypothetical protein